MQMKPVLVSSLFLVAALSAYPQSQNQPSIRIFQNKEAKWVKYNAFIFTSTIKRFFAIFMYPIMTMFVKEPNTS